MNVRKPHPVVTVLATLLALLATLHATAGRAAGQDDPIQQLVDDYLAAYPGGVQINATDIAYGILIVSVAPEPGILATPDCPSGWFCFYDDINFGYPRGKLSSCGWQDLAWWGWHDRTESVHYNMSSGSVWFINHASGTTHTNDVLLFQVSTAVRTDADVSPYRNMADHVYRDC